MNIVGRFVAQHHIRVLRHRAKRDPQTLADATAALVSVGESAIPPVMKLLEHRDAREPAKEVLAALLSNETLSIYVEALSSESLAVVAGVSEVLSATGSYDASLLLDYLVGAGKTRMHLESIIQARGHTLDGNRLAVLLARAGSESRNVMYRVLDANGDTSLVPHLLPLLHNESWWVRLHTLKLLARFRTDEGAAGIASCLKDENKSVRLEAVRVLGKLKEHAAVPALCDSLRDADLKVNTAAIDVLIDLGDVSAVTHLIGVLKDESEQARRGAVEVLNEVATTDAIRDLVSALRDEDWWVRVRAADALGTLGGERVVDAILGLMREEDEFLRRYAVEILNAVPSERAVEPLIRTLSDEDWWVRERSIDALAKTGDARAVEPLIGQLHRDESTAVLCARALGTLGDGRAVEPLCALVDTENEELRREVGSALKALEAGSLTAEERDRIHRARTGAGVAHTGSSPNPLRVRPSQRPQDPEVGRPEPGRPADEVVATAGHFQTTESPAPRGGGADAPGGAAKPPDASAAGPRPAYGRRDLLPDTIILDRFRVLRKIGHGGFGSVYLVEDTAVKDELILKILNQNIAEDDTMGRRFIRELKYTRRITHKNVIRIYDLLELEGSYAISMEYFPSQDLGTLLKEEGHLSLARALHIAEQICEGLIEAHGLGIIHRDIKPPNILVGEGDRVKICDFGLASMIQSADPRLTKSGILIGTPHYMAPEQISGDEIDGRTDLYSLGTMLYEMISGHRPFGGETAVNLLFSHLEGEAVPLQTVAPDVPEEIEQVVMKALAREPEARLQTAEAMLEALRELAR